MGIYKQLTLKQRYQIYAYMKAKYSQTEIADLLGVHIPDTRIAMIEHRFSILNLRPAPQFYLSLKLIL